VQSVYDEKNALVDDVTISNFLLRAVNAR